MRKIIVISAAVAVVTVVGVLGYYSLDAGRGGTGSALPGSSADLAAAKSLGDIKTVTYQADRARSYATLSQLAKASDTVFVGDVVETRYFDRDDTTFTMVMVRVSSAYKGDVKEGDVLPVLQIGGVTTEGAIRASNRSATVDVMPQPNDNQPVRVIWEGTPLVNVNDQLLYFTVRDTKFLGSLVYSVVGGGEGQFAIVDGVASRQVPSDEAAVLSSLSMKLDDLPATVRSAVANSQ